MTIRPGRRSLSPLSGLGKAQRGEANGRAKLTEPLAQLILDERDKSEVSVVVDFIAFKYDIAISKGCVWDIWSGRRWSHLRPSKTRVRNPRSVKEVAK